MALCCFDTKENVSVKEKLVFPVYFYIWECGVKSSFLPRSKIAWKCPDNKILCDFLCILQLFIYLSLGGQLVLSLGGPQPSLTLIARSDLISPAMGFSAKIVPEEGLAGGVGHHHLLISSMGLSLSQAQVHQEGLRREGNRGLRRRNSAACDREGEIANATFVGGPPGFSPCCRALCAVVGCSCLPQAP